MSSGVEKLNVTKDPDLLTLRFLQYGVGTVKEQAGDVQRSRDACLWAPVGLQAVGGLRAPEPGDAARQVSVPPSGEAALQRCHGFLCELRMLASVFQNAWGKGDKN